MKINKIVFFIICIFLFLGNINLFADDNILNDSKNEEKELKKFVKSSNFLLDLFGKNIAELLAARIDYILAKNGFNDHIRRVLNQQSDIKFQIIEKGKEDSKSIKCGQIGVFEVSLEDARGTQKAVSIGNSGPFHLNLGISGLGSSFDLGVLDMKIGERRKIETKTIDVNLKNIKQRSPYELKELANSDQKVFINAKLLDIFDGEKERKIQDFYENRVLKNKITSFHILKNFSPEIHCGSMVILHWRILDEKGLDIYNSSLTEDKFNFHLGSAKMPLIFQYALDKMHYGDQKILFCQSDELKELLGFVKNENLRQILLNRKNLIIELNPLHNN